MKGHIEIRELRTEDHAKAIRFAVRGMHFDWYMDSPLLQNLYGRYFWYLEMGRATQVIAAYVDGALAGVLLAEMYGGQKRRQPWHQRCYVKLTDAVQRAFFKGSAGLYEETVQKQRRQYGRRYQPDGEIIFLAADPALGVKGVGTALLRALEEKEKSKTVFLHTDDACTYQFYEHRGFERAEDEAIVLDLPRGRVPLRCLLYSKQIP